MSVIVRQKEELRARAKAARAGCDPALGAAMAAHVLRDCLPAPGAVIGGFWPLPGEIDTRLLLRELAARGYGIALPETPPPGAPLLFRRWRPAEALLPGRFGTRHPAGPQLQPDFILLPLLAFDARGHRLGYGAGYYDRTLTTLPHAYRLACAFAAQEVASVPTEPTDLPLNAVATELGIRRFQHQP